MAETTVSAMRETCGLDQMGGALSNLNRRGRLVAHLPAGFAKVWIEAERFKGGRRRRGGTILVLVRGRQRPTLVLTLGGRHVGLGRVAGQSRAWTPGLNSQNLHRSMLNSACGWGVLNPSAAAPPACLSWSSCSVCPAPTTMSKHIGIPIKVMHDAEGHTVTVELKNGEVYRGKLDEAEDNMNVHLSNCTKTMKDGRVNVLAK